MRRILPRGEVHQLMNDGTVEKTPEFRDAVLLHGHAVECVGPGDGALVVRDDDELRLRHEAVEDFDEAVDVFQEEHPPELLQALRVAVGAGVLTHDVLDGLDEMGGVWAMGENDEG
ncbi:MAG: hypothetical protein K8R23_15550 [Chthoniobacter sp.]|nr:hypothetical protein [Chthoniobacter sp.]